MSANAHHVVITAESDHHILITSEDHRQLLQLLHREYKQCVGYQSHLFDLLLGLHRACIVRPAEVPRDVVTMDSVVELADANTEEREMFTLVYPESENIAENMLSILAPLGTAILGCRVGEVVSTEFPIGTTRTIRVGEIVYQPEHYER